MSNLIHNEQTKLRANWLNGIAVAVAVIGVVTPTIAGYYKTGTRSPLYVNLVGGPFWVLLSYRLHQAASLVLGGLIDE